VGSDFVDYYSIPSATVVGLNAFSELPVAIKVVLENMLRFEGGGVLH